jgi:hypothetical protein
MGTRLHVAAFGTCKIVVKCLPKKTGDALMHRNRGWLVHHLQVSLLSFVRNINASKYISYVYVNGKSCACAWNACACQSTKITHVCMPIHQDHTRVHANLLRSRNRNSAWSHLPDACILSHEACDARCKLAGSSCAHPCVACFNVCVRERVCVCVLENKLTFRHARAHVNNIAGK